MNPHLRIARPVTDLDHSVAQYRRGLGFEVLGSFVDHDGFDGVMLGLTSAGYHLEFTVCRTHPVKPSPTPEDLLVFYVPDPEVWADRCNSMREAAFREAGSFNPYWNASAKTYEDRDGYRVVIARLHWPR